MYRGGRTFWLFVLILILSGAGWAAGESTADPASSWQGKLKAQIAEEERMEGRSGHAERVEAAMKRLMDEIAEQNGAHPEHAAGSFRSAGMMQQMDQGFFLGASLNEETVRSGGRCPSSAKRREYDLSAIEIEITLNQWGDYYPGYMYVLTDDIRKVRAEAAGNKKAREADGAAGVSTGLQTDLIQPLTLRANQGECVVLIVRNQLESGSRFESEEIGFHLHGSSLIVQETGHPATSANPETIIKPGKSRRFEWYIRPDEQEGAHMFHSHVGEEQTLLGLFGGFIVEPAGSVYLDPISGKETNHGWQVMLSHPNAPDLREFVIFYHEVGDKAFRILNRNGEMNPQRDPVTDAYDPGHRALNYRSEPFGYNNLALQEKYFHVADESLAYSAYTFGDVSNPLPRSYLGDPAKFRLIHGGGEVLHSHHAHGGSIRWLRQPRADGKAGELFTAASDGPVKYPVVRTTSDRVDVQVVGPSEALDLETECGSGLCQQLAGDFLFHCHIAHHYVSGMWSYWRVYNTLQHGDYPFGSTDTMPPLQELPDRKGRMKRAITSDQLVGKTVDWYDKKWNVTADKSDWLRPISDVAIKEWVKMMLPPPGQPGHTADEEGQILAYDATVWDWIWEGNKAMGEPEASGKFPWPKYQSPMPGKRPPILFDPKTGKLAWPHMKPHFGKRMPFAPNHGPAPWLEPVRMDKATGAPQSDPGGLGVPGEPTTQPARPGEQGRWSLCPENAGRKQYTVHFIETQITMSAALGGQKPVEDPNGLIYVLQEEEAAAQANNELRRPLIYRANVYDCVDLILKSEWEDNDTVNFQASKINIHPHLIQFDSQASDGVITGFSYEQSVRPFTEMNKKKQKGLPVPMNAVVTGSVKAGANSIRIKLAEGATAFHPGTELMIGMEVVGGSEIRRIKAIDGDTITFTEPLSHPHNKGEIASVEFVRYRYWADADVGTVFWHDHAMGMTTWPHGAVGALIVEPVGSTYHNPKDGTFLRSGPIADIHSTEPIGYGFTGSFRELVVMPHDTIPATAQVIAQENFFPVEQVRGLRSTPSFLVPNDVDIVSATMLNGGAHTTGGGLNFRAESVTRRLKHNPDPTLIFSSKAHSDPSTPLLRAYLGDTLVFRLLHTMMNESHVWHLAGHAFRTERYAAGAGLRNATHVGIAERYDLVTQAGGAQQIAGDYLHYNGRASHLSEGSWGILRVLDQPVPDLMALPGRDEIPPSSKSVCPDAAPVKTFSVVALNRALRFNNKAADFIEVAMGRKLSIAHPTGKLFLLEGEESKVTARGDQPMPFTLHVNVGDCVKINLKNHLKKEKVSFSADMLAFDPRDSHGVNVGNNPGDQTVAPGKSRTYTFYAHPQYGETAVLVWDWGNFINNVRDGLFGAIIVGPRGSKYRDPITEEEVSLKSAWQVDVVVDRSIPENINRPDYRDASLFFQDEDNVVGTSFMPYSSQVAGLTGVNYRSEPWRYREEEGCTSGNMFTPCVAGASSPATPTILAHAGDPVRIHVFGAFSEQNQVFGIEGHEWPFMPNMPGSDRMSSLQLGGSENLDIYIKEGAGGPFHLPGDYLWQNHRLPYVVAGQWGYLRVLPIGDRRILPLSSSVLMNKQVSSSGR